MMRRLLPFALFIFVCLFVSPLSGQSSAAPQKATKGKSNLVSSTFSGLKLRSIGPALMSGRICDIAIHPQKRNVWYVAVACGGVWKTENAGTTWKPIFDHQKSYSIGCLAIDPNHPETVWVGTGENNSQRSVGFGDGVYKSNDGGKRWQFVGLKSSEHIGKILIDPRNSDVVYVAAQGPLWTGGGERGLFKTTDGGKHWQSLIKVDEHTGVSDLAFDPRDPDVIYASTYQRRRRQWTLINGGPGSGLWRSTDAGKTWSKLSRGLPGGNVGRIGIAVSPQKPDVIYSLIEATSGGGLFRSTNRGNTWQKMSSYMCRSPQYYQELYACPFQFDRIYSMDVRFKVSEDGGKTWQMLPQRAKHVDNHALAFQLDDPNYLLCGCDGGLYQSFDRGQTWKYTANLPITQFYKCCVDNAKPFYNIYGGTQDNNTQGGPVRTDSSQGITNADWFITVGGDGFKPQVDPENPNIVYSQSQYGGLRRFDRKTGSRINIKPHAAPGEQPLRFNWDSPLLISPHDHQRLYYGAQRLFRSDDRGDSWQAVSPDLTQQIDRNKLKVMGKVWPIDAVSKNRSTSYYGTLVSCSESPLVEGLLYTGADDGRLAISEDGGKKWRFLDQFPGVPKNTYIADIEASRLDPNTVFVVFNNHKSGDFKPYICKSTDRGNTWQPIQGDLPAGGPAWTLVQDHVRPGLLFVGTEFGVFFTVDGGTHWIQLESGVPVIAIRDLEIQRRENDLVCASFGRGFYVLDDYTPLRNISENTFAEAGLLFPVKRTWIYTQTSRLGGTRGSQGSAFYTAPNPPYGAVFTYWVKKVPKSLTAKRKKKEKQQWKESGKVDYPTWQQLRNEQREEKPVLLFTITDEDGQIINQMEQSATKGLHRTTWSLRLPGTRPTPLTGTNRGPRISPGTYTVTMSLRTPDKITQLGKPQSFKVVPLHQGIMTKEERTNLTTFQHQVGRLQGAISSANTVLGKLKQQASYIEKTVKDQPTLKPELRKKAKALGLKLADLQITLTGDTLISKHQEPAPTSIQSHISRANSGNWNTPPTKTQHQAYNYAATAFEKWLPKLKALTKELKNLNKALDQAKAPWTPGRTPNWKR